MNAGLIRAIGALAGLAAGSLLTPQPLLGIGSAVHVAWDGSACPPGNYSMTSTATSLQTGESFQTTAATFALPAAVVDQDFPDLPDGTYHVIANVADADGQSFHSFTQTLTVGFGPAPAPPNTAPPDPELVTPDPPLSAPIVAPPAPPAGSPAAGGGSGTGVEPPANPKAADPDESRLQGEIPLALALNLLALFPTDLTGGGTGMTGISVTAVDVDSDGTIDFISLAVGDTVMTWRVSGALDLNQAPHLG